MRRKVERAYFLLPGAGTDTRPAPTGEKTWRLHLDCGHSKHVKARSDVTYTYLCPQEAECKECSE